ncbi:MaoC family dehydratase [Amycolatopsis sp. ATCC 39116]|uniref:MaoC family dehydratase n=1 Tax=Amycolatopsis sp. (strain ATCC 39116 / 75iv2) TaxID=385957 RepID=UPI000262557A|nr:MaoC family dehydratase [Amycolatopsis sp. ATCC 39116]
MRVFSSLQEFERAVGTRLGHGEWLEVTQDRVDCFADATGDHQWIHVDPERAATGPFGTTIAHGFLTLSLVPLLTEGIVRVEGFSAAVNYGCNKVRFPAHVPVGSRIRAGVELVSVERAAAGALSTTRVTVELDGSEKPVCVADTLTLMIP